MEIPVYVGIGENAGGLIELPYDGVIYQQLLVGNAFVMRASVDNIAKELISVRLFPNEGVMPVRNSLKLDWGDQGA